jgi:hypothetical protein
MSFGQQMFTVIATKGAERVQQEIKKLPEDSVYELKPDTWPVAHSGTTRKLAEQLGIRGGENGSGIAVAVDGYAGHATGDFREWAQAQWPKNG